MGPDFMSSIGTLALLSPGAPNGLTFDMDDLKEHSFPIEHDVSLTRRDFNRGGDDITFYQPFYDQFIANYKGLSKTTLKVRRGPRAHLRRSKQDLFQYPPREHSLLTRGNRQQQMLDTRLSRGR